MKGKKAEKRRKMTRTKRILAFVVALLLGISVFHVVSNKQASAAAGDVPAHDKTLTVNNDGTYTIALNVTGDSEKDPQKVNIIVIVDRSNSMNEGSGTGAYVASNTNGANMYGLIDGEYVALTRRAAGYGNYTYWYNDVQYTGQRYVYDSSASRIEATRAAVNGLANTLLGYNGKDGNPADTVEMALVSFATGARTDVAETTDATTFVNAVNGISPPGGNAGGTNWEMALRQADSISFGDTDPTYVIFFSDGAPTFYGTGPSGTGGEQEPNMANSYNASTDEAAALATKVGVERFYTIFAYGSNAGRTYMSNLTTAAGAPAGNNYSASSTAELEEAFAQILESIEMAGIGNVGITDGTTSNVTTTSGEISHLLDVDPNSFKYYRAGGLENGVEKYDSSANGGLGEAWTDAPAASFENGAVKWNIEGVLENDVTYTVTFDCWPSQETLDIVADIKNDPSSYNSLDANIKKYIDEDGNLKTNTTASLTYTDTRTGQTGNSDFENPDPVETTAVEQLAVSKEWKNNLEGNWEKPESINLNVTRDGAETYHVSLGEGNSWTDSVFISIGIMRTHGSDPVELLTTGHNFTFTEPDNLTYHWEIDVPTVRPMLIDNELQLLIKVDAKHPAPSGATTYTLPLQDGVEGGTYYVGSASDLSLTATNERRSSINILKAVDGEDAPADAEFPFTLTVKNSLAPAAEPQNDPGHDSDWWVWISVRDMSGTTDPEQATPVTDAVESGATSAGGGWYYGVSGQPIVINMKDGYSLRINNLPADSEYTITEGTLPEGFIFDDATIAITQGTGTTTSTFTVNKDTQTATGKIEETNTLYQATVKNKYQLTDIEVTKVWEDNSNQDGIRPTVDEFTELLTLSPAVEGKTPAVVDNGDNTFTITYTGLPRYNNGEEVEYTVTEAAIEGYTTTGSPAADHGTITNTHEPEKTTVTVEKVWVGPASEAVMTLMVGNTAVEGQDPVTLPKADGSLTHTWTGLDKYANGELIEYTVTEAAIENYVTTGPEGTGTEEAPFTFTNTRDTGELTVKKTVVSDLAADKQKDFTFTVTLSDNTINGEYGDMTFTSGVATFTLKDGESKTATGIPTTITYTVEETADNGFTTTKTGDTGTITKTTPSEAAFENTRKTGDLDVTKTVTSSTAADKQKDFTFTVTLSDTTISGTYGGATFTNGVATFTLKDGGKMSITGLPQSVEYTVEETAADGFVTTKTGDTGSIAETKATAAFTNTRDEGGLVVSKSVVSDITADKTKDFTFTVTLSDTTINETYNGVTFTNGVATFTLKDGEQKNITGLPTGITYTVEETADADFTTTKTGDTGEISATASTAAFTNTRKTGSLTISKKVVSDAAADADQVFTFTVTLTNGEQKVAGTYSEVTFDENGQGTVTLKGGESKTIEGLPVGTAYTVDETAVDGFVTEKTGDTGSISEEAASSAAFTNTRETGSFVLSKTVVSDKAADAEVDFNFTVTLSDTSINGTYGGMTFTNGVATPTLKGGQSVSAEGLPTGITYTITEAAVDGFTTTKTGDTGTVATGDAAQAVFTNTRETGNLTVTKTVTVPENSGLTIDTAKEFNFTVTLSDTSISGEYGDITFTDGVATFTLKHGETVTAEGLPTSVTYIVAEEAADGYETAKTGDTGTITKDGATAAFTNAYSVEPVIVDPPVQKVITGNDALYNNGDFTFVIANTAAPEGVTAPMPAKTSITNTAENELANRPGFYEFGEITFTVPGTYTYTVTESGSVTGVTNDAEATKSITFTVTDNGDGTLTVAPPTDQAVFTFTNEYKTGELRITKTVVNPANAQDATKFTFTVNFTDATGAAVAGEFPYTIGETTGTIASGGTLELAGGETAVITGIPDGVSYTVTEESVDGYTNTAKTGDTGSIVNGTRAAAAFTNTYSASGEVVLEATKAVTGAAWPAGKSVTFTLSGEGGTLPETKTVTLTSATTATFDAITYTTTDAGQEYTYTITETSGFGTGWTPSGPVTVTVAVVDNGDGTLTATPTYTPENKTITNTYSATGSVELEVIKELVGAPWPAGQTLTFTLSGQGGTLPAATTVTLTEAGTAKFGAITYTEADAGQTYNYTISEDGFGKGWTSSGDVTVSVEVTDNGDGTLTATPTYTPGTKIITNTYEAEGTVTLTATKEVTGAAWPEGKTLTFTLTGSSSEHMPEVTTATLSATGTVSFGPIAFSQDDVGKSFTYTITEDGFGEGWTGSNDGKVTVVVTVADNGDGTLTATPVYTPDTKTITNTYTATGEATLNAVKAIEGAAWPEGKSLTFTVTAAEGTPMPAETSKTLTAAGSVSFGKIAYTEADAGKTYTYTISEGNGFGGAWTGSGDITATVKVTDNGNGTLATEVTYSPDSDTITNTYAAEGSVTLEAKKQLVGRTWKDGETVTFTLLDSNGAKVEEKTIGANGTITFTAIKYTQDDLKDASGAFVASKEFVYTISETSTLPGGVTKSADITATVTVTNNGDGTLGTSVVYTADDTIINTYTSTPDKAQIYVTKTIEGYIDGEDVSGNVLDRTFNFTMTGPKIEGTLQKTITTSGGTGTELFAEIEYTLADMVDDTGAYVAEKEFTYLVTETAGSDAGFTYDTQTYNVVVKVQDQDGRISVTDITKAQDADSNVHVINTFTEESLDVTLHVTKVIEDQSDSAQDKEFTFQLLDADKEQVEAKSVMTRDLTGNVDFSAITFTTAGVFNYYLQEIAPTQTEEGWTYDTKEYPVVITVAHNFETAELEATVTIDGTETTDLSDLRVTVTNIYKAAETTAELKVTKEVNDTSGSAYDTTFTFTLTPQDGAPMPEGAATVEKSIEGPGEVSFGTVTYEKAGTFNYTIQEAAGNAAGYTYDTTAYPVVVTVEDQEGKLVATAAYGEKSETSLTVTNTYDPQDAEAAPRARKVVEDLSKSAPDEEFTFVLKDAEGKEVETKKGKAGYVDFSTLTFDKVGTYEYVITETAGSTPGFTYDSAEHKVTITVTDEAGTGILTAAITYGDGEEAVITNPYKAEPVSVQLNVQKTVEGTEDVNEDAEPKEFTFNLIQGSETIDTQTIKVLKGSETASFGEITYEEAGTYTYTVTEKAGSAAGYTYDTTAYTAVVTVTDNAGKLEAKVTINDAEGDTITFVNTYKADSVDVDLEVSKELQGRDLNEGEFEFTLEIDGEAVETVANAADGTAKFATLTYDKVGEHTVKITEVKGELGGVTYDEKEYTGTIKITDDGEGKLAAAVELSEDSVIFINTYVPEPVEVEIAPDAKKELTGRDLKEGEFEFTLEIDGEVEEIVKNAKDGSIIFKAVTFEEVGEHTFRIYETKGTDTDISYDTTVYEGKIVITDDLEGHLVAEVTGGDGIVFKNKYNPPVTPPPVPPTGDSNNTAGWLIMMLASGTALAGILVSLNRDKARAKARARARARRRAERER